MNKQLISLVIPCYNEEASVLPLIEEVKRVWQSEELQTYDYELVFVDDGSQDDTLSILKSLKERSPIQVRYLSFSRNFGKEAAILAGLDASKGQLVALMDADLQDPPALLSSMIDYIAGGDYDCVATRRTTRKGEPIIRSLFAKLFYKCFNIISNTHIVEGARDFRLMSRPFVDALIKLREFNRFSKGLTEWVGFKTKWIEYENVARATGTTKWSLYRLFIYSADGIMAFSTVPLYVSSFMGLLLSFVSFIAIIVLTIREMIWHGSAYGWTSMVCIFCFVGGLILSCLGVIGQYLAKMYKEIKNRPIYIVKEEA